MSDPVRVSGRPLQTSSTRMSAQAEEDGMLDIPDFGAGLRALHDQAPTSVVDSLTSLAHAAGAVDVVLYLADFEHAVLTPIPSRAAHVALPTGEPVDGSPAGRAFIEQGLVAEPLPEGCRVWVPILEASDCTGVLALTLGGEPDAITRRRCEELGMLAGCAISLAARYTDLYNLVRRRKAMSLPASMQWDLLPPLRLVVPEASSTGALEPAYDVGGDSFDHSVNGFDLDVVIMDAMGHGLGASVCSSLVMGAYRHDRREGQSISTIHKRLDQVVGRQYAGECFVTGQIARLALRRGELTWINAGHPPPLLVRNRRVDRELQCRPSLPWGLGGEIEERATELLQPGDAVLFYTDGVAEGRSPEGEQFGTDRLVALLDRVLAEDGPVPVLRRLTDEVLAFQEHRLRDDATLVWLTWDGPGA
jgi:hypothetical protein